MKPAWGLIAVLVVKLIMGFIVIWQVPMWTAYHHELDTYNIVQIIRSEGRLPLPDDFPAGEFEIRQGSQPPLYALLALPVVSAVSPAERFISPTNPTPFCIAGEELITSYQYDRSYNLPLSGHAAGGYAFRVLNVIYGVLAVGFTYWAARVLFPDVPLIALVSAALVAFEPYTLRLNATIVNDNLLLLTAAAHLVSFAYLLRAERVRWWMLIALAATATLTFLTKLNGIVTVGLSVLLVIYVSVRNRKLISPQRGTLIGGGLLVMGLGAGVLLFNLTQFGSLMGRYGNIGMLTVLVFTNPGAILSSLIPILDNSLTSYVDALRDAALPRRFLQAYQGITVLALLTPLIALVLPRPRRDRNLEVALWLLLFVIGASALVIVRAVISQLGFSIESIIFAPLRYYMVGFPALMVLLSTGLSAVLPERLARWHPLGIALAVGWLVLSMITAYANIPGQIMAANRIAISRTVPNPLPLSQSADHPQLAGYERMIHDDQLDLTLYMLTPQGETPNLIGQVQVSDPNGNTVTCQFVPSRGIYPTSRWEPDEIVIERLPVRNCGIPLAAPIRADFQWGEDGDPVEIFTLDESLGVSDGCPPNLGRVADELQLTAIRTPATATRDSGYEPLINWIVLEQPLVSQVRQFTLSQRDGDAVYTCDGFADMHEGASNTDQFGDLRRVIPRGATIHADTCAVYIPSDAPLGTYDIRVALFDADGMPLPVYDDMGHLLDDNQLILDTVEIIE